MCFSIAVKQQIISFLFDYHALIKVGFVKSLCLALLKNPSLISILAKAEKK